MTNNNSIIKYMQQKYQLIQDVRTSVTPIPTENYKSPSLLKNTNLSEETLLSQKAYKEPTSLKKKVFKKTKLIFSYLGNKISIHKYKTELKPEYCNYSTMLIDILGNVIVNLDRLENTNNILLTKQKLDRWEIDLLNTKEFYALTFEQDSNHIKNKKRFYTDIAIENTELPYLNYEATKHFPKISNIFMKYYYKAGILSKNLTLVANDLPPKNFWEAYVRREEESEDLEFECLYNLIDISDEEYLKDKIDKNLELEQTFKFLENLEFNKNKVSSNTPTESYFEIVNNLIEGITLESELNDEDLDEFLSSYKKEKDIEKKFNKKTNLFEFDLNDFMLLRMKEHNINYKKKYEINRLLSNQDKKEIKLVFENSPDNLSTQKHISQTLKANQFSLKATAVKSDELTKTNSSIKKDNIKYKKKALQTNLKKDLKKILQSKNWKEFVSINKNLEPNNSIALEQLSGKKIAKNLKNFNNTDFIFVPNSSNFVNQTNTSTLKSLEFYTLCFGSIETKHIQDFNCFLPVQKNNKLFLYLNVANTPDEIEILKKKFHSKLPQNIDITIKKKTLAELTRIGNSFDNIELIQIINLDNLDRHLNDLTSIYVYQK